MEHDVFTKQPRYVCGRWTWDCAHADAMDTKSMLHGQIFDLLNGDWLCALQKPNVSYDYQDRSLHRGYLTCWGARRALVRAVKKYVRKCCKKYLKGKV